MARIESVGPYLEPVRKSVVVKRTPEEAFEIFTTRLGAWWPKHKYSIYGADTACAVEPRVGGLVYETSANGERGVWGTIVSWEPPRRFVMTWHPGGPPEPATELEVRFVPVAEGTRVELEHRNWVRLGETAAARRESYEGGWSSVLDDFAAACA